MKYLLYLLIVVLCGLLLIVIELDQRVAFLEAKLSQVSEIETFQVRQLASRRR